MVRQMLWRIEADRLVLELEEGTAAEVVAPVPEDKVADAVADC